MEYMRKYGYGGSVDRLRMAFGGKMRYANEGTKVENGDPEKPTFFIAAGRDNRGEDPTGREIAAIFVRTPEGPKQLDPKDLLSYFPEAEGDIMKAYRMAGIEVQKGDMGVSFPQLKDRFYNERLRSEYGVETQDELKEKLNIGYVPFERERDMPKIINTYRTPGNM